MSVDRRRGEAPKGPAVLQLRLAFEDVREFVSKYGQNLTAKGLFVRTRDPRAVGAAVTFELRLKTGEVVFAGAGTVRFTQLPDAKGAVVPGMGLELGELAVASRDVLAQVLAAREAGLVPAPVAAASPEAWRPLSEAAPPDGSFEVVEEPAAPPVLAPAVPGEAADPTPAPAQGPWPSESRGPPAPPAPAAAPPVPAPAPPVAAELRAADDEPPAPVDDVSAFDVPEDRSRDVALTGSLLANALAASGAMGSLSLAPAPAPLDVPDADERTDPLFGPGGAKAAGAGVAAAETTEETSHLARAPAAAPPMVMPVMMPALKSATAGPAEPLLLGVDVGWGAVRAAAFVGGKVRPLELGPRGELPAAVVERLGQPVAGEEVGGRAYRGLVKLLGQWPGSAAALDFERRQLTTLAGAEDGRAGLSIGGKVWGAGTLVERLLAAVRERAAGELGGPVARAAFAVPASMSVAARRALREAAERAGLVVERFVATPLAIVAAQPVRGARRVLVVEFGAGGLEASVVEVAPGGPQLVATTAAPDLGTIELDLLLTGMLLEQFEKETGLLVPEDPVLFERVRAAASRAKEALGEALETEVHVPELVPMGIARAELRQRLTRAKFLSLANPLFDRAVETVREALAQRGLGPGEIDAVVLAGSGSRLPGFVRRLSERLGRELGAPVASELAAMGAVLVTDERAGPRPQLGAAVGVTVVLALPGGHVRRLFERGSTLPAERTYAVLVPEGAKELELHLFQGEKTPAWANEYVGAVVAGPLPPTAKGQLQLSFLLAMTDDGDLSVRARDASGREVPVTIDRKRPPERARRMLEGR